MVESIGPRPVTTNDLTVAPVVRAPAVPAIASQTDTSVSSSQQSQTLAKELAANAPVDSNRVQRIKDALANGTFPISPATLADQLIALRYDWLSHDPA